MFFDYLKYCIYIHTLCFGADDAYQGKEMRADSTTASTPARHNHNEVQI